MDIKLAKEKTLSFLDKRGWNEKPKDLGIKLVLESSELLDVFEWLDNDDVKRGLKEPDFVWALEEELADVMMVLFQLSRECKIDLGAAVGKKLKELEDRFPEATANDLDNLGWKLKKIREHKKVSSD